VLVLKDSKVYYQSEKTCKDAFKQFLGQSFEAPSKDNPDVSENNHRYNVADVVYQSTKSFETVDYGNLSTAMAEDRAKEGTRFDFVILLLYSKKAAPYAAFKDLADRTYGVPSICMTTSAVKHSKFGDYMGNLAMKANLKTAGSNHSITGDQSVLKSVLKDTLVLGADVTHPGNGSITACPSITAIVGPVDDHAGRFLGSMRIQEKGEIITDVASMVTERIKDWVKVRRAGSDADDVLPKNILYYRDGVGDSQYTEVQSEELTKMKAAYESAVKELKKEKVIPEDFETPSFNLTAIVVAKRHNVRFYPLSRDIPQSDKGNCQPGTHVENVVISPYYQDFYLQSHSAIKGTAKPAHYFILQNGMNRSVDFYRQLVSNTSTKRTSVY
jgi:eukaryotic translation initiation factor 2C